MAYEYLFAALPTLPRQPGAGLKIDAHKIIEMCDDEGGVAARIARALGMSFDLRAMERISRGTGPGETAVFEAKQIEERFGLPEWLSSALEDMNVAASERRGEDAVKIYGFEKIWMAYYAELWRIACETGAVFLQRWIPWDWGLRRAVAAHRASTMKAEIEDAQWQAGADEYLEWAYDYRPAVDALISIEERGFDAWRRRDGLLASMRLARARELAPEYTFTLDEFASYLVQFFILKEVEYIGENIQHKAHR